jgi:hypothetical protein
MYIIEKYLLSKKGYKSILDALNKIGDKIEDMNLNKAQLISLEKSANQLSGKLKKMKSQPENDLEAAGNNIEKRLSRGAK